MAIGAAFPWAIEWIAIMRYRVTDVIVISTVFIVLGVIAESGGSADELPDAVTPSTGISVMGSPTSSMSTREALSTAPPPVHGTANPDGIADAEGVPAITVSDDLLTEGEIIAYVATHGAVGGNGLLTVTLVECMKGAQAEQDYGNRIPKKADRDLCLATIVGDFDYVMLPDGFDPPTDPTTALVVFDAVTGNLLGLSIGE